MSKQRIPPKLAPWVEAKRRHHLTDVQVQTARELGMNPKKLGKLDNHKQEPWKLPLPQFIASMAGEAKVTGTAVYLSRRADVVPLSMLHNVKHYHVLHERNVILQELIPGGGEQHQRQQAQRLRVLDQQWFVGQECCQHTRQAYRFITQILAQKRTAHACRVSFVKDQVEYGEQGIDTFV